MTARIRVATTALPEYRYSQSETRAAAARLFLDDPRLQAALGLFDATGIAERRFARPLEEIIAPPELGRRNEQSIDAALDLAERALRDAVARAECELTDIDHLLVTSNTGVATPSLDALLLHRLRLRPDLERTPLFGLGCAGGAIGVARGADLAVARPGACIAVIAVELCSLTFQIEDRSPKNLVGAALFADGAGCVLMSTGEGPGPRVVAHQSHTFPDSTDMMGFRLRPSGFELVLSRALPALVEREMGDLVRRFLGEHGLAPGDIDHVIAHPGGPKVVAALERSLDLAPDRLEPSRRFLRRHGNLSSASVLFVLRDHLENRTPAAGDHGLLLALGPGFSAELVLLEW